MCRADFGRRVLLACFDGGILGRMDGRPAVMWRAGREAALTDRFVSNFTNRLDAKGRVSIPSSFRSVLAKDGYEGLYVHQGLDLPALDAGGNALRMLLDGKRWSDPISERPHAGQVEIWSFVNLSGDAHPVHLHLVRFQVLDRRPFDLFAWNAHRQLKYTGPAEQPPPHEAGWKDTVRADPGMVTRIAVRFEGEPGRYVWHCHLLEHEDNEMMRPYELLPG